MADKKKPTSKKDSSKAVAKRAPSELSPAGAVKTSEGKEVAQYRRMQIVGKVESSSYSNPFPSPEDVAQYDKVRPSIVEWLMRMAERGQFLEFAERFVGQILAFVLGGGFLFVAFHATNAFIPLSGAALWGGIVYFLKNKK